MAEWDEAEVVEGEVAVGVAEVVDEGEEAAVGAGAAAVEAVTSTRRRTFRDPISGNNFAVKVRKKMKSAADDPKRSRLYAKATSGANSSMRIRNCG